MEFKYDTFESLPLTDKKLIVMAIRGFFKEFPFVKSIKKPEDIQPVPVPIIEAEASVQLSPAEDTFLDYLIDSAIERIQNERLLKTGEKF